jgi:hypothetical protein
MKSFPHKRSRKPPTSPENEKPFFSSAQHTPPQPFFSHAGGAIAQPKLTIGEPNSVFEQEADVMADSVVNHQNSAEMTSQNQGQIQRQTMEEEDAQAKPELMRMEEEEEAMQAKPELMRMEEEEEAQAKPELMRMEEEEEEAQAKPELMRMEEEEEEAQAKPELMRMEEEEEAKQAKADSGKTSGPSAKKSSQATLAQKLKQTKGQGQPLPAKTQKEMARAFQYDFSHVTIHTGMEAVQMTRDIQAQAFTHGNDIYFNEGKYNPESSSGKQLLAHELTHVVQQHSK